MSKEHRTTEFSAHISRSKMRRFLHDQLNARDHAEVETHLKHCERCSQAIILYIEEEEPENYKNYIKKLRGTIIETVQPKGPRFSAVQVKSMRAAAAVVILFAFSFFAFENLIDKDFNLVAKPEKQEENFKRNSVFPEDAQKKSARKVAAVQLKEKSENEEVKNEPAAEKVSEVKVVDGTPKKKKVKKPEPKVESAKVAEAETAKKEEAKKEPKPVQATSETPKVAESTAEETKSEEVKKTEDVATVGKTDPIAQVEKEEAKEEQIAPQPVAPIQKLEKVNLKEEASELTKEKPAQVVPSASVGQLRQRD